MESVSIHANLTGKLVVKASIAREIVGKACARAPASESLNVLGFYFGGFESRSHHVSDCNEGMPK